MRLFAGLAIPDAVADVLRPLQSGVRGAHWRPRENFHITLAFFDEVARQNALDLNAALAQINAPPLQLCLTGGGFFGKNKPRALWVGVSGQTDADTKALNRLAAQCKQAARASGLAISDPPYRPHITMAYCRGTTSDEAAYYLTRLGTLPAPSFTLNAFTLYSSHLGNGPSHYEVEAIYPLQKEAIDGTGPTS